MLLLVLLVAAGLRFWQLGQLPPGLYRDEAYNGLDAVNVLKGQLGADSPFYFPANNGREPVYIWLTALFVGILGQTSEAVRTGAAVAGTLTTIVVYALAKSWFDKRTGLLAAVLWAITVWPIHLSRIGLRPILLPLFFSLTLWLGTLAYQRAKDGKPATWMWLTAGLIYGVSFYTYLAVRFTPVFFILFLIYLLITRNGANLWPGIGWFLLGSATILTPMMILFWQEPELILGRSGQVSVFNSVINNGNPAGTLWTNFLGVLGLFFIKGDTIIRHNPPGRALFDVFMAIPFLIGFVHCVRKWKQPAAMALLLWTVVMLGPTILSEDAPHFLRAAGILPAVVIFPAIGLSQIWSWSKLPGRSGAVLVMALLAASLFLTVKDYFVDYGQNETTAYWFEDAARNLAENINKEASGRDVFVDQRYWEGWPSVRYLSDPVAPLNLYQITETLELQIDSPSSVYAWPFEGLDEVTAAISSPASVFVRAGSLAQGDLEPEAYPLYVRYTVDPPQGSPVLANFDNNIQLRKAEVTGQSEGDIQVDLFWSNDNQHGSEEIEPLIAFVHVIGDDGILGQSDSVPGQGFMPSQWWRPGLIVGDRHIIELENEFNADQHQIVVGLYIANTDKRLLVHDSDGKAVGDTWLLPN